MGINSEIQNKKNRRELQKIFTAYREGQTILACIKLGFFDLLYKKKASIYEISQEIGIHPYFSKILLLTKPH